MVLVFFILRVQILFILMFDMDNSHLFCFSESQLNWLIKTIERYKSNNSFDELMLDDLYERLISRDSNWLILSVKDVQVLFYLLNTDVFLCNPLASRIRSIISVI